MIIARKRCDGRMQRAAAELRPPTVLQEQS
jgi:hypothetical protein